MPAGRGWRPAGEGAGCVCRCALPTAALRAKTCATCQPVRCPLPVPFPGLRTCSSRCDSRCTSSAAARCRSCAASCSDWRSASASRCCRSAARAATAATSRCAASLRVDVMVGCAVDTCQLPAPNSMLCISRRSQPHPPPLTCAARHRPPAALPAPAGCPTDPPAPARPPPAGRAAAEQQGKAGETETYGGMAGCCLSPAPEPPLTWLSTRSSLSRC